MAMMGGFLRHFLTRGQTSRPQHVRRHRCRPEVDGLEDRQLLYTPLDKLVVTATPAVLSPANGRYVPVTVKGSMDQSAGIAPKAFFYVTDQYGAIEPRGRITMHRVDGNPYRFTYEFVIYLQ